MLTTDSVINTAELLEKLYFELIWFTRMNCRNFSQDLFYKRSLTCGKCQTFEGLSTLTGMYPWIARKNAPLIFAHPRNFIFCAPLIFAHQIHFAPLLFSRTLNFQDFQWIFSILLIRNFFNKFRIFWETFWAIREQTHFFHEQICRPFFLSEG